MDELLAKDGILPVGRPQDASRERAVMDSSVANRKLEGELVALQRVAAATEARWSLDGLLILHRYGVMHPGDPIVVVAAAARHRRDAFAAADFAMDHLKSQSWFWKREKTARGWRWIEPRPDDHRDLARW